jgi:hypothetical protein
LENGLPHIDLQREIPEDMKPRQIPIDKGNGQLIDGQSQQETQQGAQNQKGWQEGQPGQN